MNDSIFFQFSTIFRKIQLWVNCEGESHSLDVTDSVVGAHQESHCEVNDLAGNLLILSAVDWFYAEADGPHCAY